MVKSDLIEKLCNLHPNILHKDIEKIVNLAFVEIGDTIKKGMRYEIRGFGTFKLKFRKARNDARNPKTGEKIIVPEKKFPSFKMSQQMLTSLNENSNS